MAECHYTAPKGLSVMGFFRDRHSDHIVYTTSMSEVTRILDRVHQGEAQAAEELLPLVYEELRKLAGARMTQIPPGQTLQPTALVHEAWLRLVGSGQERWSEKALSLKKSGPNRPRISNCW